MALDAARVRFEDGWHDVKAGVVFWAEPQREGAEGAEVFMGWGGVGVGVDEGLGRVEAEVEELVGGVEAVAGLGFVMASDGSGVLLFS